MKGSDLNIKIAEQVIDPTGTDNKNTYLALLDPEDDWDAYRTFAAPLYASTQLALDGGSRRVMAFIKSAHEIEARSGEFAKFYKKNRFSILSVFNPWDALRYLYLAIRSIAVSA